MNLNLNKRQKIILAATALAIGLLSTQLVNFNWRFTFMGLLSILAYGLSLWALWEGMSRTKAVVLLLLPALYTLAVASFYFLLPLRWLTRLPVATFFGLSFYLLLLSQNVFNVASIRTIPLYRAASTANFLFTLIAAYFLYNVIYAFNLWFIWNGVLVAALSFPLILQNLWTIEMEERITYQELVHSFILSLILGEIAVAFSFWPMITTLWSLVLASTLYILLGLTTQNLRKKLNRRVVSEYLGIGVVVLIISFLTTSWTG